MLQIISAVKYPFGKRPKTELTCEGCLKPFYPKSGNLKQQYCSKECGYKFRKKDGKKGKSYPHLRKARVGKCLKCGETFRAINDHNGVKPRIQKYCSKICWSNWLTNK